MKMRNWLGLGRKKIDQFDLDASFQWVQQHFGFLTLAYWGMGVQRTTQFPNPFPVTLDNGQLTGSVGTGIAFDPSGQLVRIHTTSTTSRAFGMAQASVTYDRWDLLCLRYVQGSDTLIQKPSDPLSQVPLNLHDDFQIVVRSGAPAATPTYPAKQPGDIILAGLRVPAGSSSAAQQVTVDFAIRELAQPAAALRAQMVNEILAGALDGANQQFQLSQPPLSANGVVVFLDSLKLEPSDYTINAQTVTLTSAPAPSQVVSAYYVANSASTANPLASQTEQATGTADGVNAVFSLTGQPADKPSTLVFVDGVKAEAAEWALVQGVSSAQIQFAPGSIPQPAQTVSVLYFVNPATVGKASSGSSGGSGGGGAVGSHPQVEYITLSTANIQSGTVSLSALPADPTRVLLDIIGGGPQQYGVDFSVSQQTLTFQGEFADADGAYPLQVGDTLRIVYWF